jgi:hypothetical protein
MGLNAVNGEGEFYLWSAFIGQNLVHGVGVVSWRIVSMQIP